MKSTQGDLLELFRKGVVDVIIHGCNCHRAMASGIAGQISHLYPEAKMADDMYGEKGDINKLSQFSYAIIRREEHLSMGIIVNLYTQFMPGMDLYSDALTLGFKKLSKYLNTDVKIGIPEIGCGIAGGDWNVIGPKISDIMKNHDILHVEYKRKTIKK